MKPSSLMIGALSLLLMSNSPAQASPDLCPGKALDWGMNFHVPPDQWSQVGKILQPRGITRVRLGLWGQDPIYVKKLRQLMTGLKDQGIATELIIFNAYARSYPKSEICHADLAEVERNSYAETTHAVQQTADLVTDFELLNEVPLYPGVRAAHATGQQAKDFDTPCGRLQAANLRGMSRAVQDERKRTGRPLRIILGTVGRDFGFYDFMLEQGVHFDVSGYHIYPHEDHKPLDQDPWFGTGGALTQLAAFHRPITINEFNCGEIYAPEFENEAGRPKTESCLRSLVKHLSVLTHQKVAPLESVYLYSLIDEPSRAAPENRFGLMYDLKTPKVAWLLTSAFAGGALSASEAQEITRRKLLSTEQIAAWSGCVKPR